MFIIQVFTTYISLFFLIFIVGNYTLHHANSHKLHKLYSCYNPLYCIYIRIDAFNRVKLLYSDKVCLITILLKDNVLMNICEKLFLANNCN